MGAVAAGGGPHIELSLNGKYEERQRRADDNKLKVVGGRAEPCQNMKNVKTKPMVKVKIMCIPLKLNSCSMNSVALIHPGF